MKRFLKEWTPDSIPPFIAKVIYYEYWPFWLLYFPTLFYWFYLSIKARSFVYFISTNPGIDNGGAFGTSKDKILSKIDAQYLPHALFVDIDAGYSAMQDKFIQSKILFPVICKPDEGEMGFRVSRIFSFNELENYFDSSPCNFIIQEYINYPEELGVLFYRYPSGKTGITSVTRKKFLSVKGNGFSPVYVLLKEQTRGRMQIDRILKERPLLANSIPENNTTLLVEPIGNHCKGTEFINACDLINPTLVNVFDRITKPIEGFYYGRFDLKVKSIEDLYRGENIKILELNGVNCEPAHIYSHDMNLIRVYKTLFYNMKVVFEIAMENKSRKIEAPSFYSVYKKVRQHFKLRKKN